MMILDLSRRWVTAASARLSKTQLWGSPSILVRAITTALLEGHLPPVARQEGSDSALLVSEPWSSSPLRTFSEHRNALMHQK